MANFDQGLGLLVLNSILRRPKVIRFDVYLHFRDFKFPAGVMCHLLIVFLEDYEIHTSWNIVAFTEVFISMCKLSILDSVTELFITSEFSILAIFWFVGKVEEECITLCDSIIDLGSGI